MVIELFKKYDITQNSKYDKILVCLQPQKPEF